MDPINVTGSIASFTLPRHSFPLIVDGILKPILSLTYVDDAKRFIAMPKSTHSCDELFTTVQGYYDLLVDLSLVIKMGRKLKNCIIYLYNIPQDVIIPTFTSTAWLYDVQGPVNGSIAVVIMQRDSQGNLVCYEVSKALQKIYPTHQKYPSSMQISGCCNWMPPTAKKRFFSKLSQWIGLISKKTNSIQEAKTILPTNIK